MTVTVKKSKDGIRYGSFNINKIQGNFPIQAITSTNLRHTKNKHFDNPNFDFKTKIVEIIEFSPKKLVSDSEYRKRQVEKVSKMIQEYPEYLFLFTLKGARASSYKTESGIKVTPFKFTKKDNESLIAFQIECGFPLVKAFFKRARNIIDDSIYYRTLVPSNKFVASLDENLSHNAFKSLYLECIKQGDEVIAFFGRRPSKSKNQVHNKLNFAFLAGRQDDNILRLTSFISRAVDGAVSSLIFHWYGLDVYSFITRRGTQDVEEYEIKVLNGFYYVPLSETVDLACPISGKNLQESSKDFGDKPTIPVTTHDIIRLNEQFEILPERYTQKEIQEILGERI